MSFEDLILIFEYSTQQHFATTFDHVVQSPLYTWFFWSPGLDLHLTTHHLNVGDRLR